MVALVSTVWFPYYMIVLFVVTVSLHCGGHFRRPVELILLFLRFLDAVWLGYILIRSLRLPFGCLTIPFDPNCCSR